MRAMGTNLKIIIFESKQKGFTCHGLFLLLANIPKHFD